MDFILCYPTTPGHEVCPGVWLIYPVSHHWRTLIFSFPASIIASNFLVRGGTLCLFSLLCPGTLSGLYVCAYSLCEFIISPGISGICYILGVIYHLTIFLLALRHRSLSLKGEGFDKTYLGLSAPKAFSLHITHLWVLVLIPIYCKKKLLIHPSTLNLLTQPYFQSTTGSYTWYLSSCNVCS